MPRRVWASDNLPMVIVELALVSIAHGGVAFMMDVTKPFEQGTMAKKIMK